MTSDTAQRRSHQAESVRVQTLSVADSKPRHFVAFALWCFALNLVYTPGAIERVANSANGLAGVLGATVALAVTSALIALLIGKLRRVKDARRTRYRSANVAVILATLTWMGAKQGKEDAEVASVWVLSLAIIACVIAFRERRAVVTPISRWWRTRSRTFRLWAFLGLFWMLGVFLAALLGNAFRWHEWSDLSNDLETRLTIQMLGTMVGVPLFAGALWFGYRKYVD